MNKKKNSSYHHLSLKERVSIEILLLLGRSIRKIAKFLQRSVSSISEEIKKNSVKGRYDSFKAHHKSKTRRKQRRKYQPLKIINNTKLWRYVVDRLRQDWSPEVIAGRLKRIKDRKDRVNKDSIYKFIYSIYGRNLEKYLRYKGKKRRKRKNKEKRGKLKDRKLIDKRPKIIDKRIRFGDWEADFLVSSKSSSVLLVLIERRSRYILIKKVPNRDNHLINKIIKDILKGYPVLSLTLDNDIAFQKHQKLEKIIKAPIFFCHIYTSWEKGSVENVNQILRKYFKKKTDINDYSDQFIQEIENKLNHRPRRILNYQTSFEVLIENVNLKNKEELIRKANQYKILVERNKKTSLMFDV